MPLSSTDITALSRLLDEAEVIAPAEREAWLAALPAEDAHLAGMLREMLAERDATSGLLSTLPKLGGSEAAVASAGERVGPYRLLHEIGRGGMGSVWLAERADGSFERQVALKRPRLAWSEGLAERMARERRIGALLEHPAIARLYDAGLDERGRPYIAMEYIAGQPIDLWCREQKLDTAARLKLFVQVIRAVGYAHGRLVIHRDLKPANILVDAQGQAHLLDFGIAKLMAAPRTVPLARPAPRGGSGSPAEPALPESDLPADGALTQETGRVMTPHYAAPEQIEGRPVGVAADVYALGVTLYQLLTGRLPIEVRRPTLGAIEDAVLRGDAPPASRVANEASARRVLAGEVDAILHKAMQREPERRYATADAMAQDIERHLQGETVSARPDTLAYRLRKALRRHWVGVSAAGAVLVAVLAGSSVAVVQAQRAARSAERERIVRDFVAEVLRVGAQPDEGGLRAVPGDVFLDRSARLVQSRFAGQPALQADLYAVVGDAFAEMGASHLAGDYALRRIEALAAAGADADEQAQALLQLASALLDQHRHEDAEQRALRAASLADSNAGVKLKSMIIVGRSIAARDQVDRLQQWLPRIDAELARAGPSAGAAAAWAMGLRANLLLSRNRRAEALPLLRQAIDRALIDEGRDSGTAIELRLTYAQALAPTAAVAETQHVIDAALTALERRGSESAVRAAIESARLANYRYRSAKQISREQAFATLAEARRIAAGSGRALPAEVAAALDFYEADALADSGRITDALPALERAHQVLYPLAAGPLEKRRLASGLGRTLSWAGRHDAAEHWLKTGLDLSIEAGRATHPYTAGDYLWIALNLTMAGRYDEALRWLERAPQFDAVAGETGPPKFFNDVIALGRSRVLLDSGRPEQALRELPPELLGPNSQRSAGAAWEVYGAALCASGHRAKGLAALRNAMLIVTRELADDPAAPWLAWNHATVGRCALAMGDRLEAMARANQARAAFVAQPAVSPYFKVPLVALERELGLHRPPP